MSKGRVALVYPWPNLDTVPSLCNAALLLADAGYEVDVFTAAGREYEPPGFDHPNVHVHLPRSGLMLARVVRPHQARQAELQSHGAIYLPLRTAYRAARRVVELRDGQVIENGRPA